MFILNFFKLTPTLTFFYFLFVPLYCSDETKDNVEYENIFTFAFFNVYIAHINSLRVIRVTEDLMILHHLSTITTIKQTNKNNK